MTISLVKGQRVNLEKGGGLKLNQFCVGISWSGVETEFKKRGILGFGSKTITETKYASLDLSCVMYNKNGKLADHIYSPLYEPELLFRYGLPEGKLVSDKGALEHVDKKMRETRNEAKAWDNEVFSVDLSKMDSDITNIVFFLNSTGEEDFSKIGLTKVRLHEGTPDTIGNVHAEYKILGRPQDRGKRAMVLGEFYKKNEVWRFNAIGDVFEDACFADTIQRLNSCHSLGNATK